MKVKIQLKESFQQSKTRHLSVAHDRMQFKATSKVFTQLQEAVARQMTAKAMLHWSVLCY